MGHHCGSKYFLIEYRQFVFFLKKHIDKITYFLHFKLEMTGEDFMTFPFQRRNIIYDLVFLIFPKMEIPISAEVFKIHSHISLKLKTTLSHQLAL